MADDLSSYGMAGAQGYVTEPPRQIQSPQANPYNAPEQTPQAGPFDSVPFHKWLADNSKTKYKTDPWNLNDQQINSAVNDYADGPLRTVLGHQINQTRKFPSDKAREAALNDELGYYKMLAQQEVGQSIPQIRGHFQSLKPEGTEQAPAPQEESIGDTALNALTRGGLEVGRNLTGILGGVASLGSQTVGDWLFKNSDKFADAAKKIPSAKSTAGQWAEAIAGLPAGLLNAPMAGFGSGADILQKGGTVGEAEASNAKNAAVNALMAGVGGVGGGIANPLLRRAVGGAASGLAGEVARRGENALNPEQQQEFSLPQTAINTALGALGANKSKSLLNKEVGAAAKAIPSDTLTNPRDFINEPTGTQAQAGPEAADLAAKATGEPANQGNPVQPTNTAPLSKEYQGKLDNAFERIADAPKNNETPQQIYGELSKDIPQEQLPSFTEAFNTDWESAHGTRPIETKPIETQPTASTDTSGEDALAAAAQEANVSNQTIQPDLGKLTHQQINQLLKEDALNPSNDPKKMNPIYQRAQELGIISKAVPTVENILKEPITTQVRGDKGQVTNKRVPVTFQNENDQLAYLYKHGDETTRPIIADELVKRGTPTEKIQEYADKVDKDVSSSVNTLKHKVIISDRGFNKQEPVGLRKRPTPKA